MGGGDLNMKKSWHPLLMKNQERVWKEERKALEERKKTAQLQKELAEERQLQELQRIQAEQGGGRREERVDWLYATPAVGSGVNTEEQEAYLLGKKTVDKLFKEKDEAAAKLAARVASQADADKSGGGFISLQNANTARDTAAKIREDPLLAIKQQEQLALEALRKNPARLKVLQSEQKSKEERKKEKEERKREKKERKRHRDHDGAERREHREGKTSSKRARADGHQSRAADFSDSPDGHRSDSADGHYKSYRRSSPSGRHHHESRGRSHRSPDPHGSHTRRVDRSTSPPRHIRQRGASPHRRPSSRDRAEADDLGRGRASQSRHPHDRPPVNRHYESNHYNSDRSRRSPQPSTSGASRPPSSRHQPTQSSHSHSTSGPPSTKLADSKAAKLAQMQAAAHSLHQSRSERLQQLESEDSAKLKEEEAERERNRIKSGGVGDGTRAKFVREQEKKVFFGEMGLGERVKRSGGVGLVKDRE